MTAERCERIVLADLVDYVAGDVTDAEAATFEAHLFVCPDCARRAAEVEALVDGIGRAVRSSEVGGVVSDGWLNRLSRDGVRIRSFVLAPGAVVPCAVWDDDELMVLRLRGEFGDAREVTIVQRVGGRDVSRTTGHGPGSQAELLFATPAAVIRDLPSVPVEIIVTAHDGDAERVVGSYTLVHGGALRR